MSSADESDTARPAGGSRGGLGELARLFLKLGVIAFGGPAAHIAMMEDEVVTRRRWIDRQHFLDLIGATNLIPGPNSTEMTMHVGYERAGWRGLFVAGACFIGPAVLITGGLAWLYVRYGTLPEVEPFLVGIKPAVIAVILGAVWRLGKAAVKGWRFVAIGAAVAGATLLDVSEVLALLGGGALGMLWLRWAGFDSSRAAAVTPVGWWSWTVGGTGGGPGSPGIAASGVGTAGIGAAASGAPAIGGSVAATMVQATTTAPLWQVFLFFLKVGAILYGSGYVLVAFLQRDVVSEYGWLTDAQLLDAIAIGQFTPGPVLSTSTFIGYLVAGMPGAAVATLGIFLPSFLFVWVLNPIIPRLRESAWASAFLDAVNVAAVALMAAVTVELGMATLTSWPAWVIAAAATVAALRFRVNSAILVLGGAVAGVLLAPWAG